MVHCYSCGKPIAAQTIQQMVDRILALPDGDAVLGAGAGRARQGGRLQTELRAQLRHDGFVRANIDGELTELAEPPKLDPDKPHTIEVFIDRLVKKDGIRQRLTDSIELAAKLADGLVKISPLEGDDLLFSEKFACSTCGISLPGDRAPPVLVQQPGRRLPVVRRHRGQDVLRSRPDRPRRGAVDP